MLLVVPLLLISGAEAEDTRLFRAAFDRARAVLEKVTEERLEAAVEVRPLGSQGWARRDGLPFDLIAGYDRATRTVTVDPDRARAYLTRTARTGKEMEELAFCLTLHELLHAYQDGQIQRARAAVTGRWLRFLSEGHAVFFAEQLARREGVPEPLLQRVFAAPPLRFTGQLDSDRRLVEQYFFYQASKEFVGRNCPKLQDFAHLLAQPPDYPAALANEGPRRRAEAADTGGTLRRLGAVPDARKPLPLDFLDAAGCVCPPMFRDADVYRSYHGGAITEAPLGRGSAEVVLLEFTPAGAERMTALLHRYLGAEKMLHDRVLEDNTDGITYRHPDTFERGRALYVRRQSGLVALVSVSAGADAAARTLLRQLTAEEGTR